MNEDKPIVPKVSDVCVSDNDTSLLIWNTSPQCVESCPIFSHCPYAHDSVRCDLIYKFVNKQELILRESLENRNVAEFKKSVLGIGVINLWSDWVKMEIIKTSLGTNVLTHQGRPHPVFKESRETMKAIMNALEFAYGKEQIKGTGFKNNAGDDFLDTLRGD